jgi:hypothetical protein
MLGSREAMVGEARGGGDLGQGAVPGDGKVMRQTRRIFGRDAGGRHRRFPWRPSPSRSAAPSGAKPAKALADPRGGGERDEVLAFRVTPVDGEAARPGRSWASTDDDLGPPVTVKVHEAGRGSSKTSVSGKVTTGAMPKSRARRSVPAIARRRDAMSVACVRRHRPARHGDSASWEPSYVAETAVCRRGPLGGRQPKAHHQTRAAGEPLRQKRDRGRGATGAAQICFSGIWTTSPSSASETLSWQVRRERSVSGS